MKWNLGTGLLEKLVPLARLDSYVNVHTYLWSSGGETGHFSLLRTLTRHPCFLETAWAQRCKLLIEAKYLLWKRCKINHLDQLLLHVAGGSHPMSHVGQQRLKLMIQGESKKVFQTATGSTIKNQSEMSTVWKTARNVYAFVLGQSRATGPSEAKLTCVLYKFFTQVFVHSKNWPVQCFMVPLAISSTNCAG